jgi:hexosaminidase
MAQLPLRPVNAVPDSAVMWLCGPLCKGSALGMILEAARCRVAAVRCSTPSLLDLPNAGPQSAMQMFRSVCVLALAGIPFIAASSAPPTQDGSSTEAATLALIPQPSSIEVRAGKHRLKEDFKIGVESRQLASLGNYLRSRLILATNHELEVVVGEGWDEVSGLRLHVDSRLQGTLGDEGYRLTVSKRNAEMLAATPTGLFYAIQTYCQLLPPEIGAKSVQHDVDWVAPCVKIEDVPRFGWRGMMLDSGRHFFSVDAIKAFLDQMARHKMNRFHWHLTEDQGWRLAIRAEPKLTEIGAKRSETPILSDRKNGDGKPYDGFYTQDDVREIVAYAAELHIMVIPEIEMPGHCQAALAVHPELSCTGGPFEVANRWGVHHDVYCAGTDETFHFLARVLTEVHELFPAPYIHIGGDECPKHRWKECERCQKRIADEGLADEHELQAWFIQRMEAWLNARDRQIIGWDEILEGHLAPNATVMSWRGVKGGIAAAKQGHDVIMSPTSHCYLDYFQSKNTEGEPPAIGGYLPLKTVYAFEPVPEELTEDEAKHILGAQGNVWTEYIATPEHVDYMSWPRGSAIAERVWSGKDVRDFDHFSKRLVAHLERMKVEGVNYRTPKDSD